MNDPQAPTPPSEPQAAPPTDVPPALATPPEPYPFWGYRDVAMLTGLAFAIPIEAWTITRTRDSSFPMIYRFGMIPLFLFSGTFFPITQLPGWLQPVAYATPLWHGVTLCRDLTLGTAAGKCGAPRPGRPR